MYQTGYHQVMSFLSNDDESLSLSDEEKNLMADTFALLNTAYFAGGSIDQTVKEKRLSPGLALREQQPSSFYTDYIKSILKNERSDHHHILSGYR